MYQCGVGGVELRFVPEVDDSSQNGSTSVTLDGKVKCRGTNRECNFYLRKHEVQNEVRRACRFLLLEKG